MKMPTPGMICKGLKYSKNVKDEIFIFAIEYKFLGLKYFTSSAKQLK